MSDQHIIDDAKAQGGFMDCVAVRDGLGWDKPGPNGSYYSAIQTAYEWIEGANEEVVFLIPDGYTGISKTRRTGVYPDVFARVLAYKNAVYARRDYDEWKIAYDSAVKAREQEGAQTKNMNWDVYIDSLGPEPVFDPEPLERVAAIKGTKGAARQAAIQAYFNEGLPLNRKGKPRMKPLREYFIKLGLKYIGLKERNERWLDIEKESKTLY